MEDNKLIWKRNEPGDYESIDGRFSVIHAYDRLYGSHWQLTDHNKKDNFGRDLQRACDSLKHAKHTAELTLQYEKGIFPQPKPAASA